MSAIQRKFDEARKGQKAKVHSATPWKHWQVTIPFNGWEIIGANNQGIARLPGTRTEDEANARHICLCVNTHERLVDALKDARQYFEAILEIAAYVGEKSAVQSKIDRISAMLSEIEKGGEE